MVKSGVPIRRVFVVIGGSSGIGKGIAKAALSEGAEVWIAGRSSDRLAKAVEELGRPEYLRTWSADATKEEQLNELFVQTGDVDHVIVTAADISQYASIRDMPADAIRQIVDSKLVAAMLVARRASQCIRLGGSLTFTSGIAAVRPLPSGAIVAAVNSGIEGLARGLALDLAPIRVNVLSPGWVDTPVWDVVAGTEKSSVLEGMAHRLPVGRIGVPEDVAQAAMFLTRADLVTGSVLSVDGGQRLV